MKNKFFFGLAIIGLLGTTNSVYAVGNAKVSFETVDTIKVGETFTIRMNVNDIIDTYDGIVSFGGNLSFDENVLEYVSSKGINTPYLFQINEKKNYKIAGLDFTLDNGIKSDLTVYEFTFRALEEGKTVVTLNNHKLTDSKGYINTNVESKQINILPKDEQIVKKEKINTEIKTFTNDNNDSVNSKEYVKKIAKNITNLFNKIINKIK